MRPRRKTTLASLTASLAVGSCLGGSLGEGQFCDVVAGPILFPPPVAQVVVQGARAEAEMIDVQNGYGRDNCTGARWQS